MRLLFHNYLFVLGVLSIQLNHSIAFDESTTLINFKDPIGVNGMMVNYLDKDNEKSITMKLIQKPENELYSWCLVPLQGKNKKLETSKQVTATITNIGNSDLEILFWVCANKGWSSVADVGILKSGETKDFSANLRETYPDGTPKINPERITDIKIMLEKGDLGSALRISRLRMEGEVPNFVIPINRIEIPETTKGKPSAGKRVTFQLKGDSEGEQHSVLYLPKNWNRQGKYPVIVEYPGNIYFTKGSYSTGEPEQCAIGYGMNQGKNAIWISLPFVDYTKRHNIINGWGNPDDTADYTVKMIDEIVEKFGGDPENIIVTGFSRGAIACRYIGLRNERIAKVWKGFHECQHYDGDGWNGSTLEDAKTRLQRLGNRPVFETDNNIAELKQLLSKANVAYVESGLNEHATAMFLDDRPSTLKLREWFNRLVH